MWSGHNALVCDFWREVITSLQTVSPSVGNKSFPKVDTGDEDWGSGDSSWWKGDCLVGAVQVTQAGPFVCVKGKRPENSLQEARCEAEFWLSFFCFLIQKVLWKCWSDFWPELNSTTVLHFSLSSSKCPGTRTRLDDAVVCFSLAFDIRSERKRSLCSWDSSANEGATALRVPCKLAPVCTLLVLLCQPVRNVMQKFLKHLLLSLLCVCVCPLMFIQN